MPVAKGASDAILSELPTEALVDAEAGASRCSDGFVWIAGQWFAR